MVVKRVADRAGLNLKQCVTKHNNKCAEGALLHELLTSQVGIPSPPTICGTAWTSAPFKCGLDTATSNRRWCTSQGIRSKDAAQKINSCELATLVA